MQIIQALKKLSDAFTLMFVEDDASLRQTSQGLFENFFRSITLAKDGQEALDIYNHYFQTQGKFIDIVITDIKMPHQNGIELTRNIFKINPKQKVLVISAHDDRENLIELINLGVSGFVPKPFQPEEIFSILLDICQQLSDEQELYRFLDLGFDLQWDRKFKQLSQADEPIKLTEKEQSFIDLLVKHPNQKFTPEEIFDYLYLDEPQKSFSEDSIKSFIKRLRKKIPHDLILNTPNVGYALNRPQA